MRRLVHAVRARARACACLCVPVFVCARVCYYVRQLNQAMRWGRLSERAGEQERGGARWGEGGSCARMKRL